DSSRIQNHASRQPRARPPPSPTSVHDTVPPSDLSSQAPTAIPIGGRELMIQLLRLAIAFTNAAEDAHAPVLTDHVVDHFHDQHGPADPGAPEETGFSAAFERRKQVDRLDARTEDLRPGRLLTQGHRGAMD